MTNDDFELEAIDNMSIEHLEGGIRGRFNPEIIVSSSIIAQNAWRGMVAETQSDLNERSIIIARKAGKILRSKLRIGDDKQGYQPLEFGLKSFLSPIRSTVLVHSHPLPKELDNIHTTFLSDQDISAFAGSNHAAVVMVDPGGAHLLARTSYVADNSEALQNSRFAKDALTKNRLYGGGIMGVIHDIASAIPEHGLGYYYTPDLDQSGPTVTFQNMSYKKQQ